MAFLSENLHISGSLLRAVIDTAVDGIMIIDQHGGVRLYNAACEKLFGYTAAEVVGQNVKMLMPPPYRDEHDGYIQAYKETGIAQVIGVGREVTGQRKDGSHFPIKLSIGEAQHSGERYFVGIVHEISEQKLSEENLRKAKEEAESANRAKSDFLAVMSHEIRSPLHGILATTDLLKSTELTDKQDHYLDTIDQSGETLVEIVDRLLDLSRIEAGAMDVKAAPIVVRELFHSLEILWKSRAEEKGCEYFTSVAHEVPPILMSDGDRIREILDNLVGNAVKFTEDGYIAVKLKVGTQSRESQDGRLVLRFEVKDTGIGIDPANQSRLFERFEQVNGSLTREHEGAGLGLAICKELSQLLGGNIGVSSELGKGALFWFTVPCSALSGNKSRNGDVPRDDTPGRTAGGTALRNNAACLSVLVAEDNPTNQTIIRDILELHGHRVDIVSNGQEAVHVAAKGAYDLILMDVRMPVMDGLEATRRIREDSSPSRRVPIIAMTAHAMNGARAQCIASGMNDYISKPFTIARINEIVSRFSRAA